MRTSERHKLKEDAFAVRTGETLTWAVGNRRMLTIGGIIVVVVLAVVIAGFWYTNLRNQAANLQLGKAMQTYSAPLRTAETPAESEVQSFATAAERARAAHDQFQKVADQYGWTKAGRIARYMSAVTELDMGDAKAAEQGLKGVAGGRDADLASLAKLALAGLYRDQHRTGEAQKIYQELISHPSNSVTKATAQLQLASLYANNNQGAEAGKLYSDVMKDDPRSFAASVANQKLSSVK